MRISTRLLITFISTACAALAQGPQNMDFYFMGGFTPASKQSVPWTGATVTTGTAAVLQLGWAYQLYSCRGGDLYVEVPQSFVFRENGRVNGEEVRASSRMFFFTPGVKFKLATESRLAPYGVAGGGYGGFSYYTVKAGVSGSNVGANYTTHGVIDFGGGLDVYLSRLVSLRAEVRDFVTGRGLAGTDSRHHPVYLFGFALHH